MALAFALADSNGDGMIDEDELASLLAATSSGPSGALATPAALGAVRAHVGLELGCSVANRNRGYRFGPLGADCAPLTPGGQRPERRRGDGGDRHHGQQQGQLPRVCHVVDR